MKIKLTWFKNTGKYYTDEVVEMDTNAGHNYHEIMSWVREEQKYRMYRPTNICLAQIQADHPMDVPYLIIYESSVVVKLQEEVKEMQEQIIELTKLTTRLAYTINKK